MVSSNGNVSGINAVANFFAFTDNATNVGVNVFKISDNFTRIRTTVYRTSEVSDDPSKVDPFENGTCRILEMKHVFDTVNVYEVCFCLSSKKACIKISILIGRTGFVVQR